MLAIGPLPIASVIGASSSPCRWPWSPSIHAPMLFVVACYVLHRVAPLSPYSRCASEGFCGGWSDSGQECQHRGSLSRPSGNGRGWPGCSSIYFMSACTSSSFCQSLPYVVPTALIKAWRDFFCNAISSPLEGRSLNRTSCA